MSPPRRPLAFDPDAVIAAPSAPTSSNGSPIPPSLVRQLMTQDAPVPDGRSVPITSRAPSETMRSSPARQQQQQVPTIPAVLSGIASGFATGGAVVPAIDSARGVRQYLVNTGLIPAQGEGRMDPNAGPAPTPAATPAETPAVPAEAAPAAPPAWDPTATAPRTGTGARANPYDALSARYRSGGQPQAQTAQDNSYFDTIAAQGQRVQDARDAGNANANAMAERNNAQMQLRDQQQNDMLMERQRQLDEQVDQVANLRIDPNNWFASRGTVGSIGAAIAVGLGAAAQSLQGGNGPNNALNIINAAIERDMQAQTENMRNQGMRLQDRRSSLQQLRETFGSDRAAQEAFRMRSLQMAERQAEQAVQRAQTPQARDLAAQMQARIAEKTEEAGIAFRNQLALQNNAQSHSVDMARASYAARRTGTGSGSRQQPFSAAQLQNAQVVEGTLRRQYPNRPPEWYAAGTQRIMREGVSAAPPGFVQEYTRAQQQASAPADVAQANAQNALSAMQQGNRSQLNALLNSGRDLGGIGPVDQFAASLGTGRDQGAISRTFEQGLQTALTATGIANPVIDPPLLAEIERIIDRRNELYGAAQGDNEIQAGLPVLPDFTRMTEEQLKRVLPSVSSNLDRSERMIQLRRQAGQRTARPASQRGPFIPPEE